MKVLLLDQFSELGGAQRMLLDLLDAIRARSWTAVAGLPGDGAACDRARAMGLKVCAIPCGPYSSGRKSAADLWRFRSQTPRLAARIRELAQQVQPDLVYINGPRLLPAAAMARLRRPVLFHAHIPVSQPAARLVAGVALRSLRAHVVAVCRSVADAWRPFAGDKRTSIVYNGVAGPERDTIRNGSGPARVGCVGRISPEKGQLEFLRAAARIWKALPETRFVIAGAALFSDRAACAYEDQVREAGANLPVEFTGWVDDIYGVMGRLRLLLVPSVWEEPNPRVILESFAAGVPVIAFRRGGIPEIIEDGRTGFLCRNTDEMAARALDLLHGDRQRLGAVAQAARESWHRRFTLQRWRQEMIAEMERCAGSAAPAR